MDQPAPVLSPEELDALILQSGLVLSPAERDNVLATARALQRAAALVRSYNADAERLSLEPA
jgi:hypothetical protein